MRRTKTQPIGVVLEEFFKRPFVARKLAEGHISDYWRTVVGEHIAKLTTDITLINNILYVRMASGVVRQEIFFQRDAIMQRLNEHAGMQLVNAIIVR